MKHKTEQHEIIDGFENLSEGQRTQMLADLEEGERLFAAYIPPALTQQQHEQLKQTVSRALQKRNRNRKLIRGSWAAAAAACLIAAFALLSMNWQTQPVDDAPGSEVVDSDFWNGTNSFDQDAQLLVLQEDISQVESELMQMQLGEDEFETDDDLDEITIELLDMQDDFWKG